MTVGVAFFGRTATVALNPSDKHANIALTSANMVATKNTADALRSVRATLGRAHTDNGYCRIRVVEGSVSPFMVVGLSSWSVGSADLASYVGDDTSSWGYYQELGNKVTNTVQTAYGATWTNGDDIGIGLNNGSVEFFKNKISQGVAFTGVTGTLYPTLSLFRGNGPPLHQLRFDGHSSVLDWIPPGYQAWDR